MIDSRSQQADIAVILVTYNAEFELQECVSQLLNTNPWVNLEIIVVDNHSEDSTLNVARSFENRIRLIANPENKGFAFAVNQGVSATTAPLILLLNPDARITLDGISALKFFLETQHDAVAAAPRLIYPDGRLQPSRGTFPDLHLIIAHLFCLKRLLPADEVVIQGHLRILGRFFQQYAEPSPVQYVDYTTGACVMIKRCAFDQIGGMDDGFFLYYEEIDFALRARKAGWKWVYLDQVISRHEVASASRKAPLRPFFERYRSMVYFFRKHHPAWKTFIVCQLISLMAMCRWALACVSQRYRIDPAADWYEESRIYRLMFTLWWDRDKERFI